MCSEDLPKYLSDIPLDTLMYPNLGKKEGTETVPETLAKTIVMLERSHGIEEDDVEEPIDHNLSRDSSRQNEGRYSVDKIQSVAPGEGSKFVQFPYEEYIEENCFPHLFPEGKVQFYL